MSDSAILTDHGERLARLEQIADDTRRALDRLERAQDKLGERVDKLGERVDKLADRMDVQFRWLLALILLSGAGPIIARALGLVH